MDLRILTPIASSRHPWLFYRKLILNLRQTATRNGESFKTDWAGRSVSAEGGYRSFSMQA